MNEFTKELAELLGKHFPSLATEPWIAAVYLAHALSGFTLACQAHEQSQRPPLPDLLGERS